MSHILDAGTELAEQLADGCPAGSVIFDHAPENLEPPCWVLEPADDYYQPSDTFGGQTATVQYDLFLFVPAENNQAAARDLNTHLLAATDALDDWTLERCSKPGPYTVAGYRAHGIRLTLSNLVTLS